MSDSFPATLTFTRYFTHIAFLISRESKQFYAYMEKDGFIQSVVKWAQSHGFKEIKANIEGFDTPKSYERTQDNQVFTPDVTGTNMFNKHYLEVSLKNDKMMKDISKWKLLSELASMKGGKLYLMAPRGHVRYTRDVITQHNIPAEVVKIS